MKIIFAIFNVSGGSLFAEGNTLGGSARIVELVGDPAFERGVCQAEPSLWRP